MTVKRIFADVIFLLHAALFPLIALGWLVPSIWYFYMTLLAVTLLSDVYFGYCILSKWEFDLRKSVDSQIDYNYTWSGYYVHFFTQKYLDDIFWKRVSVLFLVSSLAINIYFHYFFR